ncbi:MAG: hypothetical protein JST26_16205 [Bacteroidetes bacterium]|nr:hypothetical protein [Bacteroidota bacterium]
MADVKEASYYDSIQLFTVGKKTIDIATKTDRKDAIAEVYLYYGNYFYYIHNIDKAKKYLTLSLNEGKKTGNKHIEDLANIRLIFMDYEQGYRDDTEQEFRTIYEQLKKTKDYDNTAELINLLGIINEEKNQFKEAAHLYLDGLALSDQHSLKHYSGVFRNNLGLIKVYTNQNEDALIDFEKGLEIAKKENDQRLVNHIQINMCLVYITSNRENKARELFNEVLEYSRKNNHPRELSSVFINLGTAYLSSNKPDVAIAYLDSAINVLKLHNMAFELTKAYQEKADILVRMNRTREARENLEESRKLLEKTGILEDKSAYYLILYRVDYAEKKYKAAVDDYLNHRKVRDSIDQTLNGKIIQELQLRYNVQKKEIELEKERTRSIQLEKSTQAERFLKWLAVTIAAVILVLLVSITWLRYSKKLREKQEQFSRQLIQNVEEERSRISQDLHDDIGQSLSIIRSKVSKSFTGKDIDPDLDSELSRVIEQTREMSHRLYPSYLEKIGLIRSVARLVESIQSATTIECSFDIDEVVEQLPVNVKTHLYRIIQECTNNTIKHSGATALKISILHKQDEFHLIYQDNGHGLSGKEKSEGMGMLSIRERAKIINGIVYLDDKVQKGLKLIVKFKHSI